jgi:putative resolvase
MPKRLVKIGEAAKIFGTTPDTLRKWGITGEVMLKRKIKGGTRYYDLNELMNLEDRDFPT